MDFSKNCSHILKRSHESATFDLGHVAVLGVEGGVVANSFTSQYVQVEEIRVEDASMSVDPLSIPLFW